MKRLVLAGIAGFIFFLGALAFAEIEISLEVCKKCHFKKNDKKEIIPEFKTVKNINRLGFIPTWKPEDERANRDNNGKSN